MDVPTHIWLGTHDSFVPREMGEYLERVIPNVELHWPPARAISTSRTGMRFSLPAPPTSELATLFAP
ncbi:hydrolase domain protein [Mycobacterium ulcerans str. Harvey]|uniref:Hydrolase domain protein n=1 Tax=Mycobacterium ulcerans str. Harvey TaxID=1299332 RepID=A0ABP3AIC3_MYCUL|nr:hydrolase domain protein [Mycobacterium ulcerans str. Harvey]